MAMEKEHNPVKFIEVPLAKREMVLQIWLMAEKQIVMSIPVFKFFNAHDIDAFVNIRAPLREVQDGDVDAKDLII